jgi:hypothetical protein
MRDGPKRGGVTKAQAGAQLWYAPFALLTGASI